MKLLVSSLVLIALVVGPSSSQGAPTAPMLVVSTEYTPWSNDHVFAYTPGGRLRALGLGSGASASPDGGLVAFVRDGALWTLRPEGAASHRSTRSSRSVAIRSGRTTAAT